MSAVLYGDFVRSGFLPGKANINLVHGQLASTETNISSAQPKRLCTVRPHLAHPGGCEEPRAARRDASPFTNRQVQTTFCRVFHAAFGMTRGRHTFSYSYVCIKHCKNSSHDQSSEHILLLTVRIASSYSFGGEKVPWV